MKNLIILIVLLCFISGVHAQTELKPAPDLTVFGFKLGEKLELLECKKPYAIYTPDEKTCIKYNKYQDMISYPIRETPDISVHSQIRATILDSKLEGIEFTTSGVRVDVEILSTLKDKYGEPDVYSKDKVQNRFGATFDKITAAWTFSNLTVVYISVTTDINTGSVEISTPKGAAHEKAKREAVLKDKKSL